MVLDLSSLLYATCKLQTGQIILYTAVGHGVSFGVFKVLTIPYAQVNIISDLGIRY
jgi:hypothetical protein